MIKPMIVVLGYPDRPQVREYHVTIKISRCSIEDLCKTLRNNSGKYLEEAGEIGAQLIRDVFVLSGVSGISIDPYRLSVTKMSTFDWRDVEPGVIYALKKIFREEAPEIIGAILPSTDIESGSKAVETIDPLASENFFQKTIALGKRAINKFLSLKNKIIDL